MKNSQDIKVNAVKLQNGDIVIGYSEGNYFIQTPTKIVVYSPDKLKEIYNVQLTRQFSLVGKI